MKINIVGSGRGWEDAPVAPIDEPSWGFYSSAARRPIDVIFDMHPIPDFLSGKRLEEGRTLRVPESTEKMLAKAKMEKVPIFSLEAYEGCIRYPIEKVVEKFNTSFFSCGLCYIIALALYMGVAEIGMYGIVLADKYEFEREGVLYWVGRAEGMGVKIVVNEPSNIFKIPSRVWNGHTFPSEIYGYEVPQEGFIENALNNNLKHHQSG